MLISTTISDILRKINQNVICLPAIQREFVWTPAQIEKLFDSIYKGYPIGTFLTWEINQQNFERYRFYGILQNYHERDKRFNDVLVDNHSDEYLALIDGQQRITALNIALQGSYSSKKGRGDNFQELKLYFNLIGCLNQIEDDSDDDNLNLFKMMTAEERNRINVESNFVWHPISDFIDESWFSIFRTDRKTFRNKVIRILELNLTHDLVNQYISEREIFDSILDPIENIINRLNLEPMIDYYKIIGQTNMDDVTEIFIRINQGGTRLSKSDLLFSTLIANWGNGRESIELLKNEIQHLGYSIDTDFVMRTCLYLTNCPILFKVDSFNPENIERIKVSFENPDSENDIKSAIIRTFEILRNDIKIADYLIKSKNALIPIIYHIFKGGIISNNSIKEMKKYLFISLLNKVFGSHGDSLLRDLRSAVTTNLTYNLVNLPFDYTTIVNGVTENAKRLLYKIDNDYINSLLEIEKGDDRWLVLSLIYPDIDLLNLEVSQLYPTRNSAKINIAAFELADFFNSNNKKIANLALLNSIEESIIKKSNVEAFLNEQTEDNARSFKILHLINGNINLEFSNFIEFFNSRRQQMISKIRDVLGINGGENPPADPEILENPMLPIDTISPDLPYIPDNLNAFIARVHEYKPELGIESDIYNRIVVNRETDYPIELISKNHLLNNVELMRLIVCTYPDIMYWIIYHNDQYPNYIFDYECFVLAGAIHSYIFGFGRYYIEKNFPSYFERYIFDVLKLNGCALESISLPEQTKHYVRIAVMQNGIALEYAADTYKDNDEIVKLALKSNPLAYRFASQRLRENIEIVFYAIENHVINAKYLPEIYRENKEIAKIAVKKNGNAISYLPQLWRKDPEIINLAITQNPSAIRYIPRKARPAEYDLFKAIMVSNFSFMERGVISIQEIYRSVKIEFPQLCDDNKYHYLPNGKAEPEWNYLVRKALNRLKVTSENIFYTGKKGFWNFIKI